MQILVTGLHFAEGELANQRVLVVFLDAHGPLDHRQCVVRQTLGLGRFDREQRRVVLEFILDVQAERRGVQQMIAGIAPEAIVKRVLPGQIRLWHDAPDARRAGGDLRGPLRRLGIEQLVVRHEIAVLGKSHLPRERLLGLAHVLLDPGLCRVEFASRRSRPLLRRHRTGLQLLQNRGPGRRFVRMCREVARQLIEATIAFLFCRPMTGDAVPLQQRANGLLKVGAGCPRPQDENQGVRESHGSV